MPPSSTWFALYSLGTVGAGDGTSVAFVAVGASVALLVGAAVRGAVVGAAAVGGAVVGADVGGAEVGDDVGAGGAPVQATTDSISATARAAAIGERWERCTWGLHVIVLGAG